MSDFSLGASWAFVSARQARRCGIHHCDLLKPRAKITSYNQHCRPAQDSACLWHLRDAGLYVFACEVGGVHPALIEAMAAQMPVLYLETPENRETTGEGGMPSSQTVRTSPQESLGSWLTRIFAWSWAAKRKNEPPKHSAGKRPRKSTSLFFLNSCRRMAARDPASELASLFGMPLYAQAEFGKWLLYDQQKTSGSNLPDSG
jgi:hypothetical protein